MEYSSCGRWEGKIPRAPKFKQYEAHNLPQSRTNAGTGQPLQPCVFTNLTSLSLFPGIPTDPPQVTPPKRFPTALTGTSTRPAASTAPWTPISPSSRQATSSVTSAPLPTFPAGAGSPRPVRFPLLPPPLFSLPKADPTNDTQTEGTGLDINEFPNLKKWLFKCVERPGFEAGRHVPTKHTALDQFDKTDEELEAEAKKNSAWILKGMKEDKEK